MPVELQVRGVCPPLATSWKPVTTLLYSEPTAPLGSVGALKVSAVVTTMVKFADLFSEVVVSVTCAVKVNVPVADGVPDMSPPDVRGVSPVG